MESTKFTKIETNLLKLLEVILNSQNILKYIYYIDSNDPLSESDVSIDLIENGNIILTLYNESIITSKGVYLFLNPLRGDLSKQPLSDLSYSLDVIMDTTLWIIQGKGELRAYRIADEFAKLVDGKNITGIGDVVITKFDSFKLGNDFSGLSLLIKINNTTLRV